MSALLFKRSIATGLLAAAAPILVGATSTAAEFESAVLSVHNRERISLGVAPLRWNAALARSAQTWADHLAATGAFEHAPELPSNPQGENLWEGTKGAYRVEQRVDAWIREKRFFKRGTFPDNSTTGNVEDVGHYTQVAWRDTSQVGCATATGQKNDILVCRYDNAGNYIGEIAF
jgi:uncharacterized protein YkwD